MKKVFLPIFLCVLSLSIFAQNEVPGASTVATSGTLTVSTLISSNTYITAIWINTSTPTFLRTLNYNTGNNYVNDLIKWKADCGGIRNTLNATSGATKSSAAIITTTWNAKDQANTTVVADGDYIVKIEMTNENYGTSTKLVTGTFTKGPIAQTVTPANSTPFSGISIKWAPVNTAIEDVELSKLYSVYPNPAISSIFVTGSDIKEVEICSLAGKSILISKEQKVDVSALPKGMYLAVIRAKNGTVVKKIEKK